MVPSRPQNSAAVSSSAHPWVTVDHLPASRYASNVQAIIYARVPKAHKEWVEARAVAAGISVQDAIDALIVDAMEADVRFQPRPPKVIR